RVGETGVGRVPSSQVVSARALTLARRFPEAREALEFYAAIVDFDGDWSDLRALIAAKGPSLLRDLAARITGIELREAVESYLHGDLYSGARESPASFFARIMLRRDKPRAAGVHSNRCPECGEPPQCGCLRPEGHGSAFFLVCSLCATEWPFPRAQCPACGEPAVFYSNERMEHVQIQVCDSCARYFHVIHLGKDPEAVPLVDEVAALAMDVWAAEQGLQKIHPNLVGV
ncbi:MAG: formate dehydrogenase accessory protein FdhE, partial [Longimicrobiales bacterium]